jgi:hypothetical protein
MRKRAVGALSNSLCSVHLQRCGALTRDSWREKTVTGSFGHSPGAFVVSSALSFAPRPPCRGMDFFH